MSHRCDCTQVMQDTGEQQPEWLSAAGGILRGVCIQICWELLLQQGLNGVTGKSGGVCSIWMKVNRTNTGIWGCFGGCWCDRGVVNLGRQEDGVQCADVMLSTRD